MKTTRWHFYSQTDKERAEALVQSLRDAFFDGGDPDAWETMVLQLAEIVLRNRPLTDNAS